MVNGCARVRLEILVEEQFGVSPASLPKVSGERLQLTGDLNEDKHERKWMKGDFKLESVTDSALLIYLRSQLAPRVHA